MFVARVPELRRSLETERRNLHTALRDANVAAVNTSVARIRSSLGNLGSKLAKAQAMEAKSLAARLPSASLVSESNLTVIHAVGSDLDGFIMTLRHLEQDSKWSVRNG